MINYAEVFQSELDKQMVADLTSGWMEINPALVKYNGGKTIKVPKIIIQGLADYQRKDGFTSGDVTLEWESHEFSMDRARSFSLDSMDVDETNFAMSAGVVLGEFQRIKVAPEVDAYRYSKIATKAIAASKAEGGYTPSADTILQELSEQIAAVQDIIGENEPLVITISTTVAAILDNAKNIEKHISVIDFVKGGVNLKVKAIDEIPLMRVPSARMKTAYVFADGKTTGQEEGGFTPAASAKDINWLITARSSVPAITKVDKPRIFTPDQNQKADAWKIDYRRYHDLFIPDNKKDGIFTSIRQSLT